MFVLKRNQIIITALIVMIAVAGYLNYQDSKTSRHESIPLTDDGEIAAIIAPSNQNNNNETEIGLAYTYNGEADNPSIATEYAETAAVSGKAAGEEQAQDPSTDENPGESVFVYSTNTVDSTGFIQAKLEREQARSKEKGILTEIINNENLDQDKKAEAADAIMDIQKRIEKESAAEAMIEAKGFSEAYVRIDDDGVDVLVSKESLTEAEIAQIEDIVKRKTGMSEDKIHISSMKSKKEVK